MSYFVHSLETFLLTNSINEEQSRKIGEVLAPLKSLVVTVFNKMILGNKTKASFLLCLLLSSDTGFLYLY